MARRLVILTYESPQANLITNRVLIAYPGRITGIVRSDATVPGKGALASAWFLARHTGLGFVGRKAVELALSHAAWEWARLTHRTCVVPSLADAAARHAIPLIGAADVNAPATLDTIRGWQPDILISIYLNQRIRPTLLRIPTKGLPYVVGKKAGAPPDTTVVFDVAGSPPIVAAVNVPPEGRARLLDAAPPDPTAKIAFDRRTFARLAGGRC